MKKITKENKDLITQTAEDKPRKVIILEVSENPQTPVIAAVKNHDGGWHTFSLTDQGRLFSGTTAIQLDLSDLPSEIEWIDLTEALEALKEGKTIQDEIQYRTSRYGYYAMNHNVFLRDLKYNHPSSKIELPFHALFGKFRIVDPSELPE